MYIITIYSGQSVRGNMKYGEVDHKTFTYTYSTFVECRERLLLYLSSEGQKSAFLRVLASLWLLIQHLRDLTPLNLFAECVSKEPWSLSFLLYRARSCRFRVLVLPCLRILIFYHTYDFTLAGTENCFSAEHCTHIVSFMGTENLKLGSQFH